MTRACGPPRRSAWRPPGRCGHPVAPAATPGGPGWRSAAGSRRGSRRYEPAVLADLHQPAPHRLGRRVHRHGPGGRREAARVRLRAGGGAAPPRWRPVASHGRTNPAPRTRTARVRASRRPARPAARVRRGAGARRTRTTGGDFQRDMDYIPDRITLGARKPDHGPVEGDLWPVEPGRYRLVAAPACPWANRSLIVRRLLGLEDVISVGRPGRPTTSAAGASTTTPAAWTRCSASSGSRRRTSRASRLPARHHRAGDGRDPDRPGRHQRLPVDHPRPLLRVAGAPPRRTRRTCGPRTSARRWRT